MTLATCNPIAATICEVPWHEVPPVPGRHPGDHAWFARRPGAHGRCAGDSRPRSPLGSHFPFATRTSIRFVNYGPVRSCSSECLISQFALKRGKPAQQARTLTSGERRTDEIKRFHVTTETSGQEESTAGSLVWPGPEPGWREADCVWGTRCTGEPLAARLEAERRPRRGLLSGNSPARRGPCCWLPGQPSAMAWSPWDPRALGSKVVSRGWARSCHLCGRSAQRAPSGPRGAVYAPARPPRVSRRRV